MPLFPKEDFQAAFMEGKCAVQKTNRKFSKIELNHNHKRVNSKIKDVYEVLITALQLHLGMTFTRKIVLRYIQK